MKEPSFAPKEERSESGLSRRSFVTAAVLYGGATVFGAKLLNDYNPEGQSTKEETVPEGTPVPEETASEPESIEVVPKLTSENFNRWKKGFQARWVMTHDSVVYVDENNEPVAPPIAFQEFTVLKERVREGKKVMEPYALKPGAADEDGFLIDNFDPEWLRHVKALVAQDYNVDAEKLEPKHITEEFEQALKSDDTVLIAKIRNHEITRMLDLMHYYSDIPASETDNRDKITYIEEELTFTEPSITPLMAAELRSLVPALCAKESLFKDRKPNKKGARGIAQFKPSVWDGLGLGEYGKSQPFTVQVKAIGLQFGQYQRELIMNERVNEMYAQIETLFVSRESFEKNFWMPLLLTTYNAGAKRMKEVVKAFMENHSIDDLRNQYAPVDGMDLFFAMSQYAVRNGVEGYVDDAPKYSGHIYALRDVLQAEKREREVQLASN